MGKRLLIHLAGGLALVSSLSWAAPVIVEVDLSDRGHFEIAKNLDFSPWSRWGNAFVGEMEEALLSRLEESGISYTLLGRSSQGQQSYLLSAEPCGENSLFAPHLGQPVLNRQDQRFAQLSLSRKDLAENLGYHAELLGGKPIPLTYSEAKILSPAPSTPADFIQDLVDQVSLDSLYSYNQRLEQFYTRYSYADSVVQARDWLLAKFSSLGVDSVYLDHFYWNSDQWNVVATVPGTAEPDRLLVVGGHYDSVTYGQSPGPSVYAPGADDNGSGAAATLEMARIISQNPLPQTVIFIAFGQEEQGLKGGYAYADEAYLRGDDIQFMLNMDMIAYKPNNSQVKLLHNPSSVAFADVMVGLASTYAGLSGVKGSASGNSDHWPFMQKGYPSVFVHEYIFNNQGWHKNTDLTDSMNFAYMTKVTKLALATLAHLSQPACATLVGDIDGDGAPALGDLVYLVNKLFSKPGGPWTVDPLCRGDVNADAQLSLADVVHLANFLLGRPGDWTPVATGECCLL